MKLFILLFRICIAASIFYSCSKKHNEAVSDSIDGRWELRSITGGYTAPGDYNRNFAPGNGQIWEFAGTAYKYYSNGIAIDSGTVEIIRDITLQSGQIMDKMVFNRNPTTELYFEISNNVLTINRGVLVADGTIETYARLK